tara:strand:- start:86 stop:685 length:600 start_codon:yes stop_codon:yes gene_type:complete
MKKLSTKPTRLILASKSKTRKNILKDYNLNFSSIKHNVDEKKIKEDYQHLSKKSLTLYLAKRKALSIDRNKEEIVIGSDQILVLDDNIFNKAKNFEEAKKNLLLLQNNKHILISAIYIVKGKEFLWCCVKEATIKMKQLKENEVINYLKNNKSIYLNTVGAYKIENDVLKCLTVVTGDDETIKGFPIKNFIPYLKGEKR